MTRTAPLLIALFAIFTSGCARVSASQRGKLASPCMVAGLGESGYGATYRAKLIETRTAGGLPGTAPGGGCGCAQ